MFISLLFSMMLQRFARVVLDLFFYCTCSLLPPRRLCFWFSLTVCWTAGLWKNCWPDFHETWWKGAAWAKADKSWGVYCSLTLTLQERSVCEYIIHAQLKWWGFSKTQPYFDIILIVFPKVLRSPSALLVYKLVLVTFCPLVVRSWLWNFWSEFKNGATVKTLTIEGIHIPCIKANITQTL